MAESLRVVLAQADRAADDKAAMRTVRYMQGGRERMERAELLGETCDYQLLRTLRGDLMDVPHRAGASLPAGCPAPAPIAAHVPHETGGFDPTGGAPVAAPAPAAASSSAS